LKCRPEIRALEIWALEIWALEIWALEIWALEIWALEFWALEGFMSIMNSMRGIFSELLLGYLRI